MARKKTTDEPAPDTLAVIFWKEAVDRLYQAYCAAYLEDYGLPYRKKVADFVQLNHLCKAITLDRVEAAWSRAVANYFETPASSHTLADLCSRFETFYRSALDRFGKPLRHGRYVDALEVDQYATSNKTRNNSRVLNNWHKKRGTGQKDDTG
jgi:hypothetical protein